MVPVHFAAGAHTAAANNHGQPGLAVVALTVKDVGLGRCAAAFGNNIVRGCLGQGLEHHFGHEMADLHAGGNSRRKTAINDTSVRRRHFDRTDGALIDWNIRIKGAFYRHKNIGKGKIVNHIAAPIDLR